MTSISKSFAWLFACLGLFVGFIIGASLDKASTAFLLKIVPVGIIVVLVLFSRRIDSAMHTHYVETWPRWQTRGKWRFILVNYVAIRGGILFLAVGAPYIPVLEYIKYTVGILLFVVIAVVLMMIFLGHEEWTKCEEDFQIQMYRRAAEQSRIAGN